MITFFGQMNILEIIFLPPSNYQFYLIFFNRKINFFLIHRYKILEFLGKGTFGQVVKCCNTETNELVAVKVIKNHPSYYTQGLSEVYILNAFNSRYDPDLYYSVRLIEYFIFRSHLCIVFELLDKNLYQLIEKNKFRGLTTNVISIFSKQILTCLVALHDMKIIHCDLKPENILLELTNNKGIKVKVIDFGSACYENKTVYTYIQSRFYRSPEVILGLQYKLPIDIWSLGCIIFELFIGYPLFPGQNQHRMLARFIRYLGPPPYRLLKEGTKTLNFFRQVGNTGTSSDYVLMTDEEYYKYNDIKGEIPEWKEFFKGSTIDEIIMEIPVNKTLNEEEKNERKAMIHFIKQMLKWDPDERWTPHELLEHPFITGKPFTGDFVRPSRNVGPYLKFQNTQYKQTWPYIGTPTEYHLYNNGGFMSPLGTSPSSPYYGSHQYYPNMNQQNFYRGYGSHHNPNMYH